MGPPVILRLLHHSPIQDPSQKDVITQSLELIVAILFQAFFRANSKVSEKENMSVGRAVPSRDNLPTYIRNMDVYNIKIIHRKTGNNKK